MNRVYCMKCRYSVFSNCYHPSNITIEHHYWGIHQKPKKEKSKLNANNDCINYADKNLYELYSCLKIVGIVCVGVWSLIILVLKLEGLL